MASRQKIEDPFFQKVRSSTYLTEDKYSREANVMIEVKNVSGRTLYPAARDRFGAERGGRGR